MSKHNKLTSELRKASKLSLSNEEAVDLVKKCAYCGVYANTRDHVIPLSFSYPNRPDNYRHQYLIDNIVIACSECNTLASNKVFDNFLEKKKYLAEKIEKRYSTLLNYPEWTQEELNEIEGFLRQSVENSIVAKEFTKIRIRHLNDTLI